MSDRRLAPDELRQRLAASFTAPPTPGRPTVLGMVAHPSVVDLADVSDLANLSDPAEPASATVSAPASSVPAPRRPRAGRRGGLSAAPDGRTVVHRRHEGAVLRGYRIPVELHRAAERAKLRASAARGASLHWDELLQGAIDALPTDLAEVAAALPERNGRATATGATRVLQAAIRTDQDLRLRLLRLDLEDATGREIRLEDLWTHLVRTLTR